MDSDSLVPHLDPFKDCRARLIVRAEALAVDEFLLQGRPEAFHHGVVIAVSRPAHAASDSELFEFEDKVMLDVLAAAIGVVQQPWGWLAAT